MSSSSSTGHPRRRYFRMARNLTCRCPNKRSRAAGSPDLLARNSSLKSVPFSNSGVFQRNNDDFVDLRRFGASGLGSAIRCIGHLQARRQRVRVRFHKHGDAVQRVQQRDDDSSRPMGAECGSPLGFNNTPLGLPCRHRVLARGVQFSCRSAYGESRAPRSPQYGKWRQESQGIETDSNATGKKAMSPLGSHRK